MPPPPPAMVIPVRSEGTKYFFLSRSPMRALGAFSTITYGGDPNMAVRDPKREGGTQHGEEGSQNGTIEGMRDPNMGVRDPKRGRRDPKRGPLRV